MQLKDLHIRKEIYLLWFDQFGNVQSREYKANNIKDLLDMEIMEIYEEDDYVEVWLR